MLFSSSRVKLSKHPLEMSYPKPTCMELGTSSSVGQFVIDESLIVESEVNFGGKKEEKNKNNNQ
jgi:hypothetical protein